LIRIDDARELPAQWDVLAGDNYALQRRFLRVLEGASDSTKSYHLFHDDRGVLDSIAVLQKVRRFNLSQYTPFNMPVAANLLHVPLSVSRPGIVLGDRTRVQVESFVRGLPGYSLVLNWREPGTFAGMVAGTMSPQVSLRIRWKTFEDYLGAQRSAYRRRLRKAFDRGRELRFRFLEDNNDFDERFYDFYLRLNRTSRIRVERLDISWFRSDLGRILLCEVGGRPQGFAQVIENGKELVWAFVGHSQQDNAERDIYLNLILHLIRHAIENGYEEFEMGQTAEDAKLRLGGRYTPLKALIRHANPMMHLGCRLTMPWLSCRPIPDNFRVFRDQAES
jgi:hypothetical protein